MHLLELVGKLAAMSSEFARIAEIEAILRRASSAVVLGIGDDCAVLAASAYPRVWTVDSAVENVHFARASMQLDEIAFRAFMAAASDVAAMGGKAVAALSALTLPRAFSDAELRALVHGLARASDVCECPIVGGNLARGLELSLTTSVLGECRGPILTRRGARVGDGIYVTGTLGGAALGLRALLAGKRDDPAFLPAIERFVAPRARLDVAAAIAECASAAIDISDGLVQDLGHLCRASEVGARIELGTVPRLHDFALLAERLGASPEALPLSGGEDYEVLFTARDEQVSATLAARIGEVTAEPGHVVVVDERGRALDVGDGFDHFR